MTKGKNQIFSCLNRALLFTTFLPIPWLVHAESKAQSYKHTKSVSEIPIFYKLDFDKDQDLQKYNTTGYITKLVNLKSSLEITLQKKSAVAGQLGFDVSRMVTVREQEIENLNHSINQAVDKNQKKEALRKLRALHLKHSFENYLIEVTEANQIKSLPDTLESYFKKQEKLGDPLSNAEKITLINIAKNLWDNNRPGDEIHQLNLMIKNLSRGTIPEPDTSHERHDGKK